MFMRIMEIKEQIEKRMKEVKDMGEKVESKVNWYDTKLHAIIVAYLVWERVFLLLFL